MKCPSCGAEIGNTKFCEYCGSQISSEMQKEQEQLNKKGCPKCGSTNITYKRENQGEVREKKSKQVIHRTVAVCKDCGETWFVDEGVKKKKTWLWVLGWLFIFPLPLTILLLRKKDMNKILKYGIITVAWITYIVIAFSGGSEGEKTDVSVDDITTTISVSEQTTEATTEQITEKSTEKKTETTTKKAKSDSGIRPEFKKTMDDYESFFDEYIEFMETYENSDNSFEMLAEYTDFMTKYSKAMKSMDEMDEEDMSDEEFAYYLEVTARINAKLTKFEASH